MIVTFCGHSKLYDRGDLVDKILEVLIKELPQDKHISFYLGFYGRFDAYAFDACYEYKKINPNCELVFVTPYINESYLKNRGYADKSWDSVLYPDLEEVPPKFAILKRNEFMAKEADLIIAYVVYTWGGAYSMLTKAKKLDKKIINLAYVD